MAFVEFSEVQDVAAGLDRFEDASRSGEDKSEQGERDIDI